MNQNKKIILSFCAITLLTSNIYAKEKIEPKEEISYGEITVTGEKIDKTLLETTTAISVFDEKTINIGNYKKIENIVEQLPNVVLSDLGVPNIRGIDSTGVSKGTKSLMAGARPRVNTIIDGVNNTWIGVNYISGELWDLEQIEVLKGTQSTTQGRNSIGGSIIMKTKDPTFDFEGKIKTAFENQENKNQLAAVISGPLIEDQLAFRLAVDRNSGDGYIKYKNFKNNDRLNESTNTNLRAKLLYLPKSMENLSLKFTLNHREAEGGYLNFVTNPKDYVFEASKANRTNSRYHDSKDKTYITNIDYIINDDISLQTQLSFKDYNSEITQVPSPLKVFVDEKSKTFESKLIYKKPFIKGVAGVYYYDRDQDIDAHLPKPSYFPLHLGNDEIKSISFYTDNTIALNNSFDLLLGARLEKENQKRDSVSWGANLKKDIDETIFLPKIGLAYKPSTESMISLVAQKGYNQGGGSLDWDDLKYYEYDKEEVNSYELTYRTYLNNKKINLSSNIFYNDFDGFQADAANRFRNLSKVKSYGLETQIDAQITDKFNIFAAIGLLKTKISNSVKEAKELEGNELSTTPTYSANLGFTHKIHNNLEWGGNVSFTDDYYSDNENTQKLDGYTLVNLHASYTYKDFTFRTYVNNLTDEEVIYKAETNRTTVGSPRVIGAALEYKF
ncbi:TonB-dependent receptor [Malaciobacter marinus]|uniref:TonB-dependent receptor n=1 Tax=Malaciobacter marinus TaxID=505249 RepID=UPI003B0082F7